MSLLDASDTLMGAGEEELAMDCLEQHVKQAQLQADFNELPSEDKKIVLDLIGPALKQAHLDPDDEVLAELDDVFDQFDPTDFESTKRFLQQIKKAKEVVRNVNK